MNNWLESGSELSDSFCSLSLRLTGFAPLRDILRDLQLFQDYRLPVIPGILRVKPEKLPSIFVIF